MDLGISGLFHNGQSLQPASIKHQAPTIPHIHPASSSAPHPRLQGPSRANASIRSNLSIFSAKD
jgi:hypothetical protein